VDINGGHPLWGIIRLAVIFTGLTVFLWLNSSSFDRTEITTIIELMLLVGGYDVAKRQFLKNGKKKEKEE
tara:strand:- start:1297 stop:1506 length:210 start_codon:yes stop_codon:yes gene_type:complete